MTEKKIITVVTATRAEYGLLKPIIEKLIESQLYQIRIVATGMHLSEEFGLTYKSIESDGFHLDEKIPIILASDSPSSISKSMGLALIGFADYFERKKPDLLIVLGDRFETLAICCAALNASVPIAHLYGGETTEGAIDEAYRHAITKMSWLHFTSTEEYRKRVIQLGENPHRVFNVGAIGIENAVNTCLMSKDELSKSIGMSLDKKFAVVTFHPATLEENSAEKQISELLKAMKDRQDMNFIITGSNADAGGRTINSKIIEYVNSNDNALFVMSLGLVRYMSALKYSSLVIGNSSSGLIEAPTFKIPTINIGDRQKGRLRATSVIDCTPDASAINNAINIAFSVEFQKNLKNTINPYGDGKTTEKIFDAIKNNMNKKVDLKKTFFDLDFKYDSEK